MSILADRAVTRKPHMTAAQWAKALADRERRGLAEGDRYEFLRKGDGGVLVHNPKSGRTYEVRLHPHKSEYTCTCPDYRRNAEEGNGLPCKHICALHLNPHRVQPAASQPAEAEEDTVRGTCPHCGDAVVSRLYYHPGRGYIVCWECRSSLGTSPTCAYRRVL